MEDKFNIIIEKHAQDDLISIYNYLSNTLNNKQAADRLLEKIIEIFKII